MSVIFVAGVHGVGKTTCCAHTSRALGVGTFTASEIIRSGKATGVSDVEKVVVDLDENQRILIDGVRRILSKEHRLLLDGHFTLRTKEGVDLIPLRVFEMLSIVGIAIFVDDPKDIAARMSERDKVTHSVEMVKVHQNAEIDHAREISKSLAVSMQTLSAFDTRGLSNAVRSWLQLTNG